MLSDFRFAFRTLGKTPGFTTVAIFTLALAIGVNSAVFSLVNGLVLKPVVPLHPKEVVNVFTARADAVHDYRQFSYAEFLTLRENKELFADVAAENFVLAGIGRDEGIRRSFAFFVSDNFFSLMGVTPAAGRFFSTAESRPNASIPVVVSSYSLWKRFGGRPDFVGSTLRVNGKSYTVIGVTPDGFSGLNAVIAPDLWLPLGIFSDFAAPFGSSNNIVDLASQKNYTLNITARLKPGIDLDAAKARLPVLAQRLTAIQPPDATGGRVLQIETPSRLNLSTSPSDGDGSITFLAVALLAMAGCVLLIASLNLANMLLARGTSRAKEIALRLALGASRWRVIRQLLAEGLVLAISGGALGLLVSIWSNEILVQSLASLFSSMNFSLVVHTRPDAFVLGVTLLFCVAATLVFSLGPALKSSRADLVNDLKQQSGEPAAVGRFNRFFAARHCLVMAQIALSLMLLFSAGLFLHGTLKASGLDLGFQPAGQLVAELDFSLAKTSESVASQTLFRALDRVRELPGVESAAVSTLLPYGPVQNDARVVPANAAPSTRKADPNAPEPGATGLICATTPGYFKAMSVRLLRGRDFTATEARDKAAPRVAIVDETLAKKLFPTGDALDQHIRYTQPPPDGSPAEMEIIGIVSAHRQGVLNKEVPARLFVPFAQAYNANVFIHARLANTAPQAAVAALATFRSALRSIDPDLPVLQITPFTEIVEKNIGLWIVRLGAVLFGVFGGIALVLAIVGVYAVKAYAVARRTREIGIRIALGAHAHDVFGLIMKQGALQTGLALGCGLLLSLGVGRLLTRMLYQVSPNDPLALMVSAALLAAAALVACYIPARRATKVDPMAALRAE